MSRTLRFPLFLSLFLFGVLSLPWDSPVKADLTPGRSDTGFNVGPGTDNNVLALAVEDDGAVLVGGMFDKIYGINQPFLARLRKDGTPETFSPQVNWVVFAIALQPDSKILIGGLFSKVNGVDRPGIARLNRDGTLDTGFVPALSFTAGLNSINDIALQPDGKILISGDFKSGGNQYLVRLNADGSLDPGFHMGTGLDRTPFRIRIQTDGRILIGGAFTQVHGTSRNHIARLQADGTLDTGFNPGTGADGDVKAVIVQPDLKILVGGDFQAVNGTPRKRLARLNPDGSLDTTFSADLDNSVEDLVLTADGRLLAAGNFFTPIGCLGCKFLGRYQAGSSVPDPSFTPAPLSGSSVLRMAVQDDGGILIGGAFAVGNLLTMQNNIARLNGDGTLDSGFRLAGVDGWVTGAAVDSWGKTYLGGLFLHHVNTLVLQEPPLTTCDRSSIIRLNADGTCDLTFNPGAGVNGWVNALIVKPDRSTILGGSFTQVDNKPRMAIAKLNPDGALDDAFLPPGSSNWTAGSLINALALQTDQKIVIGGNFDFSTLENNFARILPDGQIDTLFKQDIFDEVRALAFQSDGKILVGGNLHLGVSSTVTVYHLMRFQLKGNYPGVAYDPSFTATVDGEVWAIHIQPDGKILIGGDFLTVNGFPCARIARLLPDGNLDPDFNPGTGANGLVAAIAAQKDGSILIGGLFNTYNGVSRNGIARLKPNGSLDWIFDPGSGAGATVPIFTLPGIKVIIPQDNGKILIGGPFDVYNGGKRYFVERLNGQTPPQFIGPASVTGELGKPFNHLVQAEGFPFPKYKITGGRLPAGLSLNENTGMISGVPSQGGAFTLSLLAYNQYPPSASRTFTLTIENALIYLPLVLHP